MKRKGDSTCLLETHKELAQPRVDALPGGLVVAAMGGHALERVTHVRGTRDARIEDHRGHSLVSHDDIAVAAATHLQGSECSIRPQKERVGVPEP